MLQVIPIADLAEGMFLDSYGDGSFRNPLTRVQAVVHSREQIDALRAEGVTEVTVDTTKGTQAQPSAEHSPPKTGPTSASKSLYRRCIAHVTDVMGKVRQGSDVDFNQSREAVSSLVEGIESDGGGMVLLAKLQRHDDYTLRHSLNVSLLALLFGKHLGIKGDELKRLGFSGLYHDVGKFKITLDVLNKPGKLSEREFEVMKRHSLLGYEILKAQPGIEPDVLQGVLNHHERYDGKGYPHKLKADQADPFSRILTIVDIFDALTSDRVYHKAKTPHEALRAMFAWRNETFHPGLLEQFVQCFGLYPPGSFVRLTDQTYALVVDQRPDSPARPLVKVILSTKGQPCLPVMVDLAQAPKASEGGVDVQECLDPRPFGLAIERFY